MDWTQQDFGANHCLFFYRGGRSVQFCFDGGDSSSSSSTSNETTTATDNGKIVTGAQAVTTGDSSIAVGAGGKYQEQGSTDLSSNSGVIDINDPKQIANLTNSFLSAYQNLSENATASDAASNQAVLGAITSLAQSSQTDGLSNVTKTYLYMGLGLFAVIVIVFYPRKNR